jgi:hypothetical protein
MSADAEDPQVDLTVGEQATSVETNKLDASRTWAEGRRLHEFEPTPNGGAPSPHLYLLLSFDFCQIRHI